jgi:hypothetical protein
MKLSDIQATVLAIFFMTMFVLGSWWFVTEMAPKKIPNEHEERIDCPIFAPCPEASKNKNRK